MVGMAAPTGFEVREVAFSEMARHAAIPNAFETHSVLDVGAHDHGHELVERCLPQPFRKDYDSAEDPMGWLEHIDPSTWILIGAFDGNAFVGGAIAASDTPGVDMLEGRSDLVVVWDLRVMPGARRRGIGSELFRSLEHWGWRRGCRELKVETQNTNPAACRFYARQGCTLKEVNHHAYPAFPDEVQLIWTKPLSVGGVYRETLY
jgi:GNAT superfamily N-acetyltransferase